ncbi:hypothetical protein LOD99_14799 [Oopsacas minuta]|uniref:Uncharacterized protein n=1 Tax=Oopsacas minuta TaxID=111878 RepID=A0AAV7KE26_9METZ|nr:hypothetical protein LOD99_14799 [Oopsacas minuta]
MLSVINWLVCLRDVRILSQVLKSSLIQMHTHLESIELYNEQLIGYKLFRIFGTILLTSSFFLTVAVVSSNIGEIVRVNSEGYCLINLIYHTHIHPLIPVSNAVHVVREIIALVTELSFSLYVLSMSIPVFAMIIISIVHRCVKRWKDKADNYRFNYDKMEPLIGKYRAY